jgi:hypothetical protein
MIRPLLLIAFALVALPEPASARSAKDCEPIQNPMEFNRCLASLSPVRGSRAARAASREPPAGTERSYGRRSVRATASAKPKVVLPQGALQVVNGRVRLSITPRD